MDELMVIPRLAGDDWLPAFSAIAPGAELAAVLGSLEPALMADENDLVELIAAYERQAAWTAAGQLAALAEFARRPCPRTADPTESFVRRGPVGLIRRDEIGTELSARLVVSHNAVMMRILMGCRLAGELPATAAALRAGQIDVSKARIITDGCANLDPAAAAHVETHVLPEAAQLTYGPFKKRVLKEVIAADPVLAQQRAAGAVRERLVTVTPLGDDMAELRAYLPLWQAAAIDTAISAAARSMRAEHPADPRTMDQLRTDALAGPFLLALETGQLPDKSNTKLGRHRGTSVRMNVTVPASVLLGISNCPGELVGYGPLSADAVRKLAPSASMRRIVTDPIDGAVLNVGTTVYRPPAGLARHVQIRDGSCVMLGCNRPAAHCELDHSLRFPDGCTADHNLAPLCKRHHILKHHLQGLPIRRNGRQPGLTQTSPGVFEWVLPTGHRYTVTRHTIAPPLTEEMRT